MSKADEVEEMIKSTENSINETCKLLQDIPFINKLEDNTEEIEELKRKEDEMTYKYDWFEVANKVNELVKAVNQIRKGNL